MPTTGVLMLVATPIGNLGDLSPRAGLALSGADVVVCEDSRRTGRLFELAGLPHRPRLLVVNDHNEAAQAGEVVRRLGLGERVVVVTDAGTPGIADPGERLVAAALAAGHRVEVIPGASAVVTALVASGLPTGRFCFEGFLPRKGRARAERLAALADEERTIVLYEAPHRLRAMVADLAEALGAEREVALARELTKLHEDIWRGTLAGAVNWLAERPPRGEYVVVVAGAPRALAPPDDAVVTAALDVERAAGASRRDAAAAVAARLGIPRRRAYELARPR